MYNVGSGDEASEEAVAARKALAMATAPSCVVEEEEEEESKQYIYIYELYFEKYKSS
jgi:hypothetical protein